MIYKIGDKLKCIKDIHYKDRDSPLIDQTFEIVDYDFVTHKNYYLKNRPFLFLKYHFLQFH